MLLCCTGEKVLCAVLCTGEKGEKGEKMNCDRAAAFGVRTSLGTLNSVHGGVK